MLTKKITSLYLLFIFFNSNSQVDLSGKWTLYESNHFDTLVFNKKSSVVYILNTSTKKYFIDIKKAHGVNNFKTGKWELNNSVLKFYRGKRKNIYFEPITYKIKWIHSNLFYSILTEGSSKKQQYLYFRRTD